MYDHILFNLQSAVEECIQNIGVDIFWGSTAIHYPDKTAYRRSV